MYIKIKCSKFGVIPCTIGQVISIGKKGLIKKCGARINALKIVCKRSQEAFIFPTYIIPAFYRSFTTLAEST